MVSRTKRLTAAVLLSGLLAWPVVVQAEEGIIDQIYRVSGWIEPTTPLTDVCVIWGYGHHALITRPLYLDGTFAPNVRTPFSAEFTIHADEGMLLSPWQYYGLFGLHDSASNGVTVAMPPARAQAAVSGGGTWEEAWYPGFTPPTEQEIANWLRTGIDTMGLTGIMGFIEYQAETGYVSQRIGLESSLVSYSTASAGGSALVNVAIVPEPATMVFATFAGAVLLPRRRRAPA